MNAKQSVAAVAMLAASAVVFAQGAVPLDLLGAAAPVSVARRTIVIAADTRYVNVKGGETVKFVVGDKSYAWTFNGPVPSFDLGRTAPPQMLDHKIVAYVTPNSLYGEFSDVR